MKEVVMVITLSDIAIVFISEVAGISFCSYDYITNNSEFQKMVHEWNFAWRDIKLLSWPDLDTLVFLRNVLLPDFDTLIWLPFVLFTWCWVW
jgi:hypothetical protein